MKRLKNQTHKVVTITIHQEREVYKDKGTTEYKHKTFHVDINQGGGRRTQFCVTRPCSLWARVMQESYVLD